jgi:hypothetical protein
MKDCSCSYVSIYLPYGISTCRAARLKGSCTQIRVSLAPPSDGPEYPHRRRSPAKCLKCADMNASDPSSGPMIPPAARSIREYLAQLQAALQGEDAAVIHEALSAAEEHLRLEIKARADMPEDDLLELISCTYGAPEEVAAAYRLAAAS